MHKSLEGFSWCTADKNRHYIDFLVAKLLYNCLSVVRSFCRPGNDRVLFLKYSQSQWLAVNAAFDFKHLWHSWTKCLKIQPCDVIIMRDFPSLFRGFLSFFSSHLPHSYDVTWLISSYNFDYYLDISVLVKSKSFIHLECRSTSVLWKIVNWGMSEYYY